MKRIFVFGASIVHGVGGPAGGWADMLKQGYHTKLFSPGGRGGVCDVYELGIPGTDVQHLAGRFEQEIEARGASTANPYDTCIVFSVGTNDSRAVNAPDNYAMSSDEFAAHVQRLVKKAKGYSHYIVGVGLAPIDEHKASFAHNPQTGEGVYFSNERIREFEARLQNVCETEGVSFMPVYDNVPTDWQRHYLFGDGLHPNSKGHTWIHDQVTPRVMQLFGDGKI